VPRRGLTLTMIAIMSNSNSNGHWNPRTRRSNNTVAHARSHDQSYRHSLYDESDESDAAEASSSTRHVIHGVIHDQEASGIVPFCSSK
jgi:hypothetical protein